MFLRKTVFALGLLAATAFTPQSHAKDAMIVLDASGSMWGEVDGKAKVSVARDVMSDIMMDWPAEAKLGLVAYGHRSKGDCSDIQTILPLATVDNKAFMAKFNAIMPKGRTPLTAAVEHAAKELRYEEDPAVVVLISDGIESCDRDPCAAAKELEKAGVDFTAHVIGFDVKEKEGQDQLRCLAENTGGEFLSATNAIELKKALAEVSKKVQKEAPKPEPKPEPKAEPVPEVTLTAPKSAVGGSIIEIGIEPVTHEHDYIVIAPVGTKDKVHDGYKQIFKNKELAFTVPGEPGEYEIKYYLAKDDSVVTRIPLTITGAAVTLTAPESAVGGSIIDIGMEPVIHENDYIVIAPVGTKDKVHDGYKRIYKNKELEFTVPGKPGEYEIKYYLDKDDSVVTRIPLTITGAEVTLTAPESAVGGSTIDIGMEPVIHENDYIVIAPVGTKDKVHDGYKRIYKNKELEFTVPGKPGEYEIKYYLDKDDSVVTRIPLTITGAEVTLTAPESAVGGSTIDIGMEPVIHENDYIVIAPVGTKDKVHDGYKRIYSNKELEFTVPGEPGEYEIKYYLAKDDSVITRIPLTITGAEVALTAPESAVGGSTIDIGMEPVIHENDYIVVAPVGTKDKVHDGYKRIYSNKELEFTVPGEPGEYEIKYYLDKNDSVITRIPLTITQPKVNITADEASEPDGTVDIEVDVIIHENDWVVIAPSHAKDDYSTGYKRLYSHKSFEMKAPEQYGEYEIRYVLDKNKQVIARKKLTVK